MALSFEIQHDGRLVYVLMSEDVTPKQLSDTFAANQSNPEFRLDQPRLVDASAVKNVDVGFNEIFALHSFFARSYKSAGTTMYIAIFAPSDYVFGLARIFQNLAEGSDVIKVTIFREMSAARAWALDHASCRNTAEPQA
jgi:hypothetical protein